MEINHSKLTKDPVLGNGIAATKDLDAGEVVICINEPFVTVVEKDALERVCSYCMLEHETSSLKRCTRCKVVRYCSAECQKLDWKLIHKNECSLLTKLPHTPPTSFRALYQLLLRYPEFGTELDPRSANLEHHVHDFKKDEKRWGETMLQAKAVTEYSKSPSTKTEKVATLLCIMRINGFRAALPDDTPIGLCYEPTLALANHSCMPNGFIMFDGRCVSIIALNPIKKDDNIFITYVDPTQSRDTRRAELRNRYFFDCNCEKCMDDENPYEIFRKTRVVSSPELDDFVDHKVLGTNAGSRIATIQRLGQESQSLSLVITKVYGVLQQSRSAASQTERLSLLKQALSDLSVLKANQLFALPPYPIIMDELYIAYVDNGHLQSALLLLLFISLNCDPYSWPQPHHPFRVTHLFTISRLLKYAASLEPATLAQNLSCVPKGILEGIDFIDATHAVLILVNEFAPKSHGRDTTFARQVQEEIREVEEVQRLRGRTGEILRRWQSGRDSGKEGILIAKRIFDGLKTLAGFAFTVIEIQTL
ncbi:SET protein [Venustampulla echinocandica]|uniref:SET protein n=1 Tax=Venustampulla echinocandica TaxID=2656787 RepID=A0A370TSS9_9HELO|nr:SET protein [Venustampulla echinocandica]RDL38590.1 SET protein [Venustampulla echinocandica]